MADTGESRDTDSSAPVGCKKSLNDAPVIQIPALLSFG